MIEAHFGLPEVAQRSLAVYLTSTLEASLSPASPPDPAWRRVMDRLAEASVRAYRGVVRDSPEFLSYFRNATPELELGMLNIGSRPARRRGGGGIETLRAIPWVFAWTQTRLLLPAWLGVGEALAGLEGGDREIAAEMARAWPFFRSTLDLVAMVLAKAEMPIAAHYDRVLVREALRPVGADLRRRYQNTVDELLALRGQPELLADHPVLARSIRLRNPYVDPINTLQASLLARLRAAPDGAPGRAELERAFVITVLGVAAGMRNSG